MDRLEPAFNLASPPQDWGARQKDLHQKETVKPSTRQLIIDFYMVEHSERTTEKP
ncbi:MAG: hypothetical protein AB1410_08605 [Acidobacteriota bacterium]